jgi:hypothetical protein
MIRTIRQSEQAGRRLGGLLAIVVLVWFGANKQAEAVPSMSRQTGAACTACHTNGFGPNLTPFGRQFKLNGYTWGENSKLLPLSGMVLGGFTNTQKDQPGANPGYSANNNFALNQISAFYGGRIAGNFGAFSQLTYDGVANTVALDLTDVRYAKQANFMGQDLVFGVSANNAPTVADLWNTGPVWGFPFATSPLAPTPGAAALIDGPLITTAGGGSIYAMINQLLYIDAGAYTTFSKGVQKGLGVWSNGQLGIDGGAPYWRVALQHDWDGQYAQIGTYGLQANVFPGGDKTGGTDQYTDVAVDATYQYLGTMEHIFELKSTFIHENQGLFASRNLGLSGLTHNTLNTFRINGAYTFEQTYQLTLGYNQISGSSNFDLYNPDAGYVNGRPNSEYFILEADYVPFGKASSLYQPWLNLRVGLQYIAYSKFNGTAYQAQNNNTFFLSGWLAF